MIKIELTLEQTNSLLNALAQLPYIQSWGLIALIQEQAGPQALEETKNESKTTA